MYRHLVIGSKIRVKSYSPSNLTQIINFAHIISALREWFKKSAEPQAEIKGSEPLHAPSDLHLEEDDEEAVDRGDGGNYLHLLL